MSDEFLNKLQDILDETERLEQARLEEQERQRRERQLQLDRIQHFLLHLVLPVFELCAGRLQEKKYLATVQSGDAPAPHLVFTLGHPDRAERAELRYSFDPNTRVLHRTVHGANLGPLLMDLNSSVEWDMETSDNVARSLLLFVDMHLKYWAK